MKNSDRISMSMNNIVTSVSEEDNAAATQSLAEILLVIDSDQQTRVQVGLPLGFTAFSQEINGDEIPALRDQLAIAASLKVDDANVFNEILANGIDPFVENVADESQVILRIVTFLTVDSDEIDPAAQSPDPTILIIGASGAGENDPDFPLRQEALVLDTRDLAPNTEIQLDNIEFAIVIGGGRITGGNGESFVIGSETDQLFVLGADNDTLRGGDGNDIIGSEDGDDQLFGDGGNDYLIGGTGNDILNGGPGDDLLQGGISFAGNITFSLDNQNKVFSTYHPLDPALGDSVSTNWFAGDKRITNDERVAFVYRDINQIEALATLSESILQRLPTPEEMNNWSASNLSPIQLSEIAFSYYLATISTVSNQSNEAQLTHLMNYVWGNEHFDPNLINLGVEFLNADGNWSEILLFMATHENLTDRLLDANGNVQLSQDLILDEVGISTPNGNDELYGGPGNDLLIDGFGNNLFDGGDGTDSVELIETLGAHTISLNDQGSIVIARNDARAVDTLIDIEEISFSDQTLSVGFEDLDTQTLKHVAGMTDLIDDTTPLWTHLNQFARSTMSITEFAQQLTQTDGYQSNWAPLSNQDFVSQLSETALGEALTGDDLDFWTDQLDQDLADHSDLFVTFAGMSVYQDMIFDGNGLALF